MRQREIVDPQAESKGELIITQQILDSYQSGVIDEDVQAWRNNKNEIK